MESENSLSEKEAIYKLYERGNLSWKLKPEQKEIYDAIHATKAQKFVINCSRRLGKSYLLCVLADEYARRHSNVVVKYAAPTQKQVRDIVKPIFNKIWKDCPSEMLPKWITIDSCYIYPNGSKVSIVGCDLGKIDRLRGDESCLSLIDEAGMIEEDLHYIIKDILIPQSLTVQKNDNIDGKVIIASTPPRSPSHAFVSYIVEAECSGLNNYIKRTIHHNSMITPEKVLEYAVEAGCEVKEGKITKFSTTFRREYLAEVITDETSAICPEFNEATQPEIVMEWKRPEYFDTYVSMDPGLIDLTAILFGYWDYLNACLVIEDEIVMNYKDGINTKIIADAINLKEMELWKRRPYMRVMDGNTIMAIDLNELHHLNFMPTDKDDKESAVNAMRLMVHGRKIKIHPKCKALITHLKYGVWNKTKTKFDRSGEFGHYDCVDALVYMVRNVNRTKNPYPADYKMPSHHTHYIPPETLNKPSAQEKVYIDLFKPEKVQYDDIFMSWFSRRQGGSNG